MPPQLNIQVVYRVPTMKSFMQKFAKSLGFQIVYDSPTEVIAHRYESYDFKRTFQVWDDPLGRSVVRLQISCDENLAIPEWMNELLDQYQAETRKFTNADIEIPVFVVFYMV